MRDDRYLELHEMATNLTEFYSEQTGKEVVFGFDEDFDLWVTAPRTNGKEYFENYGTAEDRILQLYSELFLDDDYTDPLEGV
jgi:hypothetical protein